MASSAWSRRDFLRRSAAVGGLAVGGATILGACSSTNPINTVQEARDAGRIRVGIANEQPYGFEDASGNVTGEAIEVARAVFTALGVPEVEATTVGFDSLIPALNAGQFDVVSAGMFITQERCQEAAFSIPDYTALEAFLVPRDNPQQVARYEDVAAKNLRVAVLSGAVEQGYATQLGVPTANIQVFEDQNGLLQAVLDDRVYCASLTEISLQQLVKQNPNAPIEVTDGFNPVINGQERVSAGAYVFRKQAADLRMGFNPELDRIHKNGRWLEIVRPFGFTQENLPDPDVTTDMLCSVPVSG